MQKYAAIILAAGKGTRMNEGKNSPIPKVMFEIEGKPMIDYSIENLAKAGFKKPIVVVGFKGQMVQKHLDDRAIFAWQKKRLGTAHAVICAEQVISKNIKTILVINSDDSAFYDPKMIQKLVQEHLKNKAKMTLLTVSLADPAGLGRIIKDSSNHVLTIVEEKLASPDVKKIKEVNTGCYVFSSDFLWQNLKKIRKNPTGEYFLTDLVEIANKKGSKVIAFQTDVEHWRGINTPEQLEKARIHMRRILKKRK